MNDARWRLDVEIYRGAYSDPSDMSTCFFPTWHTGVEVIMTLENVPLLNDATMDYVEIEPGQFHFIFLNPQDPHYRPPQ